MRLEGKVAVVTGAAQGIGKSVALKLAEEGANVAVVDRQLDKLKQTSESVINLGRKSEAYEIDLLKADQIGPLLERIHHDFGRLDLLVNAAGVMMTKKFIDQTPEDWDLIMGVNGRGLYFCVQEGAKQMRKSGGGGRIINFASVAGRGPRPFAPIYAASKAAVISITRSAAAAFAEDGIKVNAVCPGYVHTSMWDQIDKDRARIFNQPEGESIRQMKQQIPLHRAADLKEIAGLVAYLSSPESDYITGQSINICGGLEMD